MNKNAQSERPVPLVCFEEHHEAYYLWRYAIVSGWMKSTRNVLLHVDEHHDLWKPLLSRPVRSLMSLEDVARFTYEDLRIGSFICPAIYEGIYDSVMWMRHGYLGEPHTRFLTIWAKDGEETEYVTRSQDDRNQVALPSMSTTVNLVTLNATHALRPDHDFVLDIDLDYFACNPTPDRRLEIEITAGAYAEFCRNPYSVLRLPSDKVIAKQRNNSYFLCFNDRSVGRECSSEDVEQQRAIDEKIEALRQYLMGLPANPCLVGICRSVFSGYTPKGCVKYLEDRVLLMLSDLFKVTLMTLQDIMPEHVSMARLHCK